MQRRTVETRLQVPSAPLPLAEMMNYPSLEVLPLTQLKPYPRNARTHSKKQVRQIANSIQRFGFTNPVLVDKDSIILAGHARVAAAKLLNISSVPCVRIETMSPAEKRAYVLADNKLALNAGWDEDMLAEELQGLLIEDPGFDLGLTGFSIPEIDALVDNIAPEEPGAPEDDTLPENVPTRCQLGDLWELGSHRLACGNALEPATIVALMNTERAQMVFTDPPYNVPVQGHVGGSGAIKHREFAMASGEMTSVEFTRFLRTTFERLVAATVNGSIHFICMDWRHIGEMLAAGERTYAELKNLIVWVKDNGGMGTFYRSRHELIFAFKKGTAPHVNAFELGQHGRYRTNVWTYRGVNTLRHGRMDELALHPTVKPVQMIADAIKDVSQRGAIVLDLFAGSGSTIIAAHKTGRRAFACELDALYCDRIIARWETYAKDEASLVSRIPQAN
jgi:DNA modification methylase